MNPPLNPQPAMGDPRSAVRRSIAFLLLGLVAAPLLAHDLFREYVRHRTHLALTSNHLDLTLTLTFFEHPSLQERQRLDTDGDGHVRRPEIAAFLAPLPATLTNQVQLLINGQRLDLTPLYEPELDLEGDDRVREAHHRLTLYYFAPTPTNLPPQAAVTVETRLWPQHPSLLSLEAQSREATRLQAVQPKDPATRPLTNQEPRRFQFRILQP